MDTIIQWIEAAFGALPLPLLEVWGRLAYLLGFALAIFAFGGFTFRPGGRWGLGRERQAWDAKAVLSIPVTFVLILASGYLGSFIVLVPGAQTLESLKDLMVFLCIVLFGYPALLAVPFAYGLSDLIEGVPPGFLLDWLPGYFINPACFWIAYQLFGKNPDFRQARTWGAYFLFVALFLGVEPVLWGHICSGKFTSTLAYRNIAPALFLTTSLTWLIAPLAMLAALPLARKFGMFWAEIPGHVQERRWAGKECVWEAGVGETRPDAPGQPEGWPIRMIILTPFILLVLLTVGLTAYVTLRGAEHDAHKLATRLHQEISDGISLRLDDYLAEAQGDAVDTAALTHLLRSLPATQHGFASIVSVSGKTIASSAPADDPRAARAIAEFREQPASPAQLHEGVQFQFDHITAKPLGRETWLACATAYQDRRGRYTDWVVLTVMPESFYLAGVQTGNSRAAMVFAVALLLVLAVAVGLGALVTKPLRQISLATRALAEGDLSQRIEDSRLEELGTLARSFNAMAERRKKAEDTLREAQEFNAQIFASTQHGLVVLDRELCYLMWNPAMERMTGLTSAQVFGRKPAEIFPFLTDAGVTESMRQALEGGAVVHSGDFEYHVPETGRRGWASNIVGPIRDSKGAIIGVINSVIEITARRAAQNENRQLMEALSERVKELTCLHRAAEIFENSQLSTTDWLREIAIALPPAWRYPGDTAARVCLGDFEFATPGFTHTPWAQRAEFTDITGAHGVLEVVYLTEKPTATEGPFLTEERNLIDSIAEMLRSALNRRLAEEALTERETFLRLAQEAAHVGSWEWDLATDRFKWSEELARIHGISGAEFDGSLATIMSFYQPEDAEHLRREMEQSRTGGKMDGFECRITRRDGSERVLWFFGQVHRDERGVPAKMLGIGIDITERKKDEERIRRLNRTYAMLSDINTLIVRHREPQTIMENACRVAVEKGGFRLAWIGLLKGPERQLELSAHAGASPDTLQALHSVFDDPNLGCAFTKQALRTAQHVVCADVAHDPLSAPWRALALERGYLSLVSLPLTVDGKCTGAFNLYAGDVDFFDDEELRLLDELVVDIAFALEVSQREADRQSLEAQLRQSQKLEGIGQLAGGVAHDFNNILGAIMMQAELTEMDKALSPDAHEGLREIRLAAERAATLTRQLLMFSRRQVMQPRLLDVNVIITGLTKMLQRIIGEDIRIQLHLHPTPLQACADAGMIDQILMNLAVNARDAMPGGGRLLIETGRKSVDEALARRQPDAEPGEYLWLSVSDSGTGIPPEVLPRIFEPFFTTKEPGKGTGLGLATVFGIVKQHRGWMQVESEPGKGTCFRIYLPASTEVAPDTSTATAKPKPRGGQETILLVEDDTAIRVVTRALLERNGYQVVEAANGVEALKVWPDHSQDVALLLTDLVMPGGISGQELARHLQNERKNLKVILTSGYSADIAGRALTLRDGENFVQKPCAPDHLLETVRRCLDELDGGHGACR